MAKAKTVREIVDQVNRDIAQARKNASSDEQPPVNINNGTLTGGQHVTNVTINGDYIPGNKQGKK
jgi:archaellum component FlaF (FlaF/FlaG flagellin family)